MIIYLGSCFKVGDKTVDGLIKIYKYYKKGLIDNMPEDDKQLETICEKLNINKRSAYLNFNKEQFDLNYFLMSFDVADLFLDLNNTKIMLDTIFRDSKNYNIDAINQIMQILEIKTLNIDLFLNLLKQNHNLIKIEDEIKEAKRLF